MALAVAVPAHAYTVLGWAWPSDYTGVPCGTKSVPFRECTIGFVYDSTITSRGWDGAVRGGAYDWCYANDPDHANSSDFCFEDLTYAGGLKSVGDASAYGVTVAASNEGGKDASGSIPLGYSQVTLKACCNARVSSSSPNYIMLLGDHVDVNSNAAVSWYAGGSTVPAGKVDLKTVATHEFGHAAGLNHTGAAVNQPPAPVMHCYTGTGYANYGQTDDFNGLRYLYGGNNAGRWGTPRTAPC
jgi:hypothetical protein